MFSTTTIAWKRWGIEMETIGIIDGPPFTGTIEEFYEKYKQCTQCKHWKIKLTEFSPHNSRPCGYQAACKSCRSKARLNPSMKNQMRKGL